MDTRLKNIETIDENIEDIETIETIGENGLKGGLTTRKITCVVSSLIFVIAGYVAYFELITLYGVFRMDETVKYFLDEDALKLADDMSRLWGIVIVSLAIALIALIVSVVSVGRKMNRFDRVFADVQLAVGVGAGILFCLMSMIHGNLIFTGDWFTGKLEAFIGLLSKEQLIEYRENFWMPWTYEHSFEPRWVEALFDIVATTVLLAVCLILLLSVVKKIKAGCFWRYTIIGRIVCVVSDGIKESENYYWKVMGTLIAGVILSASWVGAVPVIVVIFLFVPKMLKKYLSIRDGVRQVASGNLDYKIPVTDKGELDRLARDINSISEATSIAVANELKNQRMKTDLISNVSHDLKTPLTSMVSYVDLLKTEGLDSENAPQYLDIIDEKTSRLQKLTEDLFEAAKASSGAIPVHLNKIEMASIISQAMAELEERLDSAELQVIYTNRTEDSHVLADGQLLWRVIENLLVNVSKYALPGSRVYMELCDEAGTEGVLRLEIKNISKDPLNISAEELMERFKRGDESRNTEGSGLGLAIAKDLTGLMDGEFDISIDGDLFKATVKLPKALD